MSLSRLDKLIAEMCPNGVEHLRLGNAVEVSNERNAGQVVNEVRSVTNAGVLASTEEYFNNVTTSADTSNYKIVRPGMFAYNPSRINIGSIAWLHEKKPVIVSPMYVVFQVNPKRLLVEFLDLLLRSPLGLRQISGMVEVGARFRFPYSSLEKIVIPIPPLEIQQEIASVLDSFTELEAELEAELYARNKQYEYYRDQVFAFDESRVDTRWTVLSQVCDVRDGTHDSPNRSNEGMPLVTSKNLKNGKVDLSSAYLISVEDYEQINRRSKVDQWDVLVSMIGTVGEVAVVTDSAEYAIKNVGLIKTESEQQARYIAHYLRTGMAQKHILSARNGTAQKYMSLKMLRSFPIPVPPLEEQNRIVEILDKFDVLVNDISIGLPAEITARRKQYEYYRNKLLTFPELAS